MSNAASTPPVGTVTQGRPVGTLMQGRRGVVMGVANDRSLGWAIAAACAAQGAEMAFTYQGEALGKRVRPLAESLGSSIVTPCDVGDDASIDAAFTEIGRHWDKIDFLVHAIGWADKAYLRGKYLDTPREAFRVALDISCYSFIAVAQRAVPMMRAGGSLLTLTYSGGGAGDAALQRDGGGQGGAGKLRALPGGGSGRAGHPGERHQRRADEDAGGERDRGLPVHILRWNEYNAPLGRNTSMDDVGGAGLYLLSPLSSGVTGEVHHVDSGYHIVGMKNPAAPDINVAPSEGG